ncbi:hypothetical protein ACFPYN_05850 [Paenisporosarcina macmurdoensis]|uniref:Uncharacterized protein n=1 Tax=Paenisporosarcina macmurdoensis TaxID=212659 RepID=A0ABW1L6W4_9BACL
MKDFYELIKEKVRDEKKYELVLIDESYDEKAFGNFLLLYKFNYTKGLIRFINDRGQLFVEIKTKKDWEDIFENLDKKVEGIELNKEKIDEVFTQLDLYLTDKRVL